MRKGMMGIVSNTPVKSLTANVAVLQQEGEEVQEEAMFVGGEPQVTGPVVLSPDESRRLWDLVRSKEPIVLTARMQEAIANYKQTMSEVVD